MREPDIRGRFPVEASLPNGGMVRRPMGDRNWAIQQYTGYPSSTVKAGQWSRGSVAHFAAPTFRPSRLGLEMYDPTDPLSWHNAAK